MGLLDCCQKRPGNQVRSALEARELRLKDDYDWPKKCIVSPNPVILVFAQLDYCGLLQKSPDYSALVVWGFLRELVVACSEAGKLVQPIKRRDSPMQTIVVNSEQFQLIQLL